MNKKINFKYILKRKDEGTSAGLTRRRWAFQMDRYEAAFNSIISTAMICLVLYSYIITSCCISGLVNS